ncbi:RraA family protein [Geomicrobium sp. JCM 19038]|uniref:RraA family protein n=1 Tax=Geomicrobium sp. JCM 19038 TaxID=1460635 RepID=UPI00045F3AEF|nr:RraA family protein [Geomicrobium sp. JCM 19038]GAK08043.1 demethylmenaquinone methyltransferase [Geomicrobium sp. JCM 19038]
MIRIVDKKMKYTNETMELMQPLHTSTIGHFTDFGFVNDLKTTHPGNKISGTVVTVKLSNGDGKPITEALNETEAGDILIIDTSGNKTHACWGEFRSLQALATKVSGVIINGAITDLDTLWQVNLPVYYETVSAKTTKPLNLEAEIHGLVSVGGVVFESGDYVIATRMGFINLTHWITRKLSKKHGEKKSEKKFEGARFKRKLQIIEVRGTMSSCSSGGGVDLIIVSSNSRHNPFIQTFM